jgi:hypothetical protein
MPPALLDKTKVVQRSKRRVHLNQLDNIPALPDNIYRRHEKFLETLREGEEDIDKIARYIGTDRPGVRFHIEIQRDRPTSTIIRDCLNYQWSLERIAAMVDFTPEAMKGRVRLFRDSGVTFPAKYLPLVETSKEVTDRNYDKIVELRKKGLTYDEIAARLDMKRTQVFTVCHDAGVGGKVDRAKYPSRVEIGDAPAAAPKAEQEVAVETPRAEEMPAKKKDSSEKIRRVIREAMREVMEETASALRDEIRKDIGEAISALHDTLSEEIERATAPHPKETGRKWSPFKD